MPNEEELLRRTVEDLKKVPYEKWRHFDSRTTAGFTSLSGLIHVCVYHEITPAGGEFGMEVHDICEEEKKNYNEIAVRYLYEHLESQRTRNLSVSQLASTNSSEGSLLEKLSQELNRK